MSKGARLRPVRLRRLAVRGTFRPLVSVADVLHLPGFIEGQVVAGEGGLNRPVEQVNVIQIPTNRYVKKNELVLSPATVFREFDGDPRELLAAMADRGISALSVRGASLPTLLGPSALGEARERSLPLIELPPGSHLSELQTEVLELIVQAATKQLNRTREIRSQLADHILSGGGLEAIPEDIATITGGDVVLVGRDGEVLTASEGADQGTAREAAVAWTALGDWTPARTDDDWILVPIIAGSRRMGCLVARLGGHDPVQWAALQQGATLAGFQILHRREAADASARFREGFIRDLLTGALDPDAAHRRAQAIGWEPDTRSYQVIAVAGDAADAPRIVHEVSQRSPNAITSKYAQAFLVICPHLPAATTGGHARTDPRSHTDATKLANALSRLSTGVRAGISGHHAGLNGLRDAVTEARIALRVAQVFDRRMKTRCFGDLGVLRFLVEVPETELRAFATSILSPIDEMGEPHRFPLFRTLELFVESRLNVAETARRGGWHYNTVRSRVRRLRELLGPFTESGTLFVSICLALFLRRELGERGRSEPSVPSRVSALPASSSRRVPSAPATHRPPVPTSKTRAKPSVRRRDAAQWSTVAEVLRLPCLRDAQLVAGQAGIGRVVETAGVLDVTDLSGIRPNQLVLTNAYALLKLDLPGIIRDLVRRGASALGVKLSTYWRELPSALVDEADAADLPTLILPEGPFDEIVNPVLTSIAGSQLEALRGSEDVHERLTHAALRETGEANAITKILTQALKRPSAVFNEEGELLAAEGPARLWEAKELRARIRDGVGSDTLTIRGVGYFVASAPVGRVTRATVALAEVDGSESLARSAVAHAAVVAGMLLVGKRQVERVYRRYERELLEELVDGRLLIAEDARSRAAAIGWPVDEPYVVLMAGPARSHPSPGTRPIWLGDDELASLSRSLRYSGREMRLLLRPQGIGIVAHLHAGEDPGVVAQALAAQLGAQQDPPDPDWIMGVSRPREQVIELGEAFREAALALFFAPRVRSISGRIAHFSDLGAIRLLSQARDPGAIREECMAVLGPLVGSSARHKELIDTLDALLQHNMRLGDAAADLYLHYNTVRHRLSRLRELLGDVLDSWERRLALALAVAWIRLLETPLGAGTRNPPED